MSEGLASCSDHGSDALMWAAGKGDSEHVLLEELLALTGGAGIDRETHLGDNALTIASSRQGGSTREGGRVKRGEGGGGGVYSLSCMAVIV